MRCARTLGWLLVAVLIVAAGCSGRSGGASQATPKDTVRTLHDSLMNNNKAVFVGCFKADAEERKFLEANFAMAQEMLSLKKAIEKEYGADAWGKFQDAEGSHTGPGFEELTDEKLDSMKVEITGDRAVCTMPGEEEPLNMVKVGDKWMVDTGGEIPTGEQAAQAVKMMDAMKSAITKVKAQVGKPDQTPESLSQMLGEETMKAMFGGMDMEKMMGDAMKKMMEQAPSGE